MHLTAVVGLVVEEMDERRRERLFDIHRVRDRAIAQERRARSAVRESLHVGDECARPRPAGAGLSSFRSSNRIASSAIGRVALCR